MRKTMYVLLILLVSVAWAAAQQSNPGSTAGSTSQTSPSSDAGQTGSTATPPSAQSTGSSSSSGQSGASSQATSPSGSASSSSPAASTGNEQMIEGCLGGSVPNFTVTDNSGTVYKLGINESADTSVLTKHVGESVRVKGNVTGDSATASSSTGAAGNSAKAASGKTIEVTQIGRGTTVCPSSGAGAASGSSGGSMSGSGSSSGAGSSSNPGSSPTPSPK